MGLAAIMAFEGFAPKATIPTKNDVPTVGYGSTQYPDGSRVKLGDTITKERAVIVMKAHVSKDEMAFKASLPDDLTLYQWEYDAFLDFSYQFGIGNWRKSAMRSALLAGDYQKACDALLKYKFSGGYDCSTPGNKRCAGVWQRQKERHKTCLNLS
jgi:GH24 family phage-related lysozyme (muramidase)